MSDIVYQQIRLLGKPDWQMAYFSMILQSENMLSRDSIDYEKNNNEHYFVQKWHLFTHFMALW